MSYIDKLLQYKTPQTSIRLIDVCGIVRSLHAYCSDKFDEMQLTANRRTDVIEWIVMEVYNDRFQKYGHRLSGHYMDDDAKTIYSTFGLPQMMALLQMTDFTGLVEGGTRFTGMLSGTTLIISKELDSSGT